MESAITVDDLSKRYSIGASRTGGYRTLREAIVQGVSSPLRRLRGRGEKAATGRRGFTGPSRTSRSRSSPEKLLGSSVAMGQASRPC